MSLNSISKSVLSTDALECTAVHVMHTSSHSNVVIQESRNKIGSEKRRKSPCAVTSVQTLL